jgi:uncharacterized membrane protein
MLAEYDSVVPGLALRLVNNAEAETLHRRNLESQITTARIEAELSVFKEARLGQVFAFLITLAALGAGTYTALHGQPWAGSVLGLAGAGGIVATFVVGRGRSSAIANARTAQAPAGGSKTAKPKK